MRRARAARPFPARRCRSSRATKPDVSPPVTATRSTGRDRNTSPRMRPSITPSDRDVRPGGDGLFGRGDAVVVGPAAGVDDHRATGVELRGDAALQFRRWPRRRWLDCSSRAVSSGTSAKPCRECPGDLPVGHRRAAAGDRRAARSTGAAPRRHACIRDDDCRSFANAS